MARKNLTRGWKPTKPRKAKKGPTKSKKVFMDCGGKGCKIRKPPGGYRVSSPPGFDYTTPNAINDQGPIKPRKTTFLRATQAVLSTPFSVMGLPARSSTFVTVTW